MPPPTPERLAKFFDFLKQRIATARKYAPAALCLVPDAVSRLPDLVHQELWAWLTVHYAVAVLIARAAEAADLDPDRIGFTRALRIIRRTATGTADICP